MTDRPIIYSAPMINGLIAGRKTQTRRLATSPLRRAMPGDRLWVKENFAYVGTSDPGFLLYAATWQQDAGRYRCENIPDKPPKWRPSIHMPRALSRITLTVTGVRSQNLHEITDEDATAEGIIERENGGWHVPGVEHDNQDFPYLSRPTPREMYAALWDTLHGGGAWLSDPAIIALTFTVAFHNIDRDPV